jgi:hypothetical protein
MFIEEKIIQIYNGWFNTDQSLTADQEYILENYYTIISDRLKQNPNSAIQMKENGKSNEFSFSADDFYIWAEARDFAKFYNYSAIIKYKGQELSFRCVRQDKKDIMADEDVIWIYNFLDDFYNRVAGGQFTEKWISENLETLIRAELNPGVSDIQYCGGRDQGYKQYSIGGRQRDIRILARAVRCTSGGMPSTAYFAELSVNGHSENFPMIFKSGRRNVLDDRAKMVKNIISGIYDQEYNCGRSS